MQLKCKTKSEKQKPSISYCGTSTNRTAYTSVLSCFCKLSVPRRCRLPSANPSTRIRPDALNCVHKRCTMSISICTRRSMYIWYSFIKVCAYVWVRVLVLSSVTEDENSTAEKDMYIRRSKTKYNGAPGCQEIQATIAMWQQPGSRNSMFVRN